MLKTLSQNEAPLQMVVRGIYHRATIIFGCQLVRDAGPPVAPECRPKPGGRVGLGPVIGMIPAYRQILLLRINMA